MISQISLAATDSLGPDRPSGLPSIREVMSDIAIGFRFLWDDVALRTMSMISFFFNFFGLMTGAVFIPFLKRDFGASDIHVGYALGIGAVGALAGSYLGGRLPARWPFGRIMIVAYVVDGVLFMPVAFTHSLGVAIFFLALTNACVLLEVTQLVGWRTRLIPEDLVGRVFGAARLITLGGTVPGAIVGGFLADRYGARLPIILSGFGYLAMALAISLFPAIRREAR